MPKPANSPEKMDFVTSVGVAPNTTNVTFQPDMARVRAHLGEIIAPEAVERWLNTPQASLNNQIPRNLIRRGKTDEVLEVIARVEYGIHV